MSAKVACAPSEAENSSQGAGDSTAGTGIGATFSPAVVQRGAFSPSPAGMKRGISPGPEQEEAPAAAAAAPAPAAAVPAEGDGRRRLSLAMVLKVKAKAKALIGMGGLGRERVLRERAAARARLEAAHPELKEQCARHDGDMELHNTPAMRARRTLETDPDVMAVLDKWVASVGKRLPATTLTLQPTAEDADAADTDAPMPRANVAGDSALATIRRAAARGEAADAAAAAGGGGGGGGGGGTSAGAGAKGTGAGAGTPTGKGKGKRKGSVKGKGAGAGAGASKGKGKGAGKGVKRRPSRLCVEGIEITFDMYKVMYEKLHAAFEQGGQDEAHGAGTKLEGEALEASIRKDWAHDARGGDVLTAALLRKAIFQIADMWVHSISARDYVEFLETLHAKVFPKKKKKKKKNWWDRMHADITMNQFLTDAATKMEKTAWKDQRQSHTAGLRHQEKHHMDHCIVM